MSCEGITNNGCEVTESIGNRKQNSLACDKEGIPLTRVGLTQSTCKTETTTTKTTSTAKYVTSTTASASTTHEWKNSYEVTPPFLQAQSSTENTPPSETENSVAQNTTFQSGSLSERRVSNIILQVLTFLSASLMALPFVYVLAIRLIQTIQSRISHECDTGAVSYDARLHCVTLPTSTAPYHISSGAGILQLPTTGRYPVFPGASAAESSAL
ncbi:hypothetical protein Bbelb_285530 [Branchiostoma belcheri]|nr:hypothetical protein Bbelb_285530 [Branchiostoma belcheri]